MNSEIISEIITSFKNNALPIKDVKKILTNIKQTAFKHPLSISQKGLWTMQKFFPQMTGYNVPFCFTTTCLNTEKFKEAVYQLVKYYPILNSVIKEENNIPYQYALSYPNISFQEENLANLQEDLQVYLNKIVHTPFNLESGPLCRIYLFHRAKDETIILINIHHIIFDGNSVTIFIQALEQIYQNLIENEPVALTDYDSKFYDYAHNEKDILVSQVGEARLKYWQEELKGDLPVLDLTTDNNRSNVKKYDVGNTYSHEINSSLYKKIKKFSQMNKNYPSTFFMGMFSILLHKYTNQDDIIIGTPVNQRKPHESQSIGFYINMVPIRTKIIGQDYASTFIEALQKKMINGAAQNYPLPALIQQLNIPVSHDHMPVFQTILVYQDNLKVQDDHETNVFRPMEGIVHQNGEGYDIILEVIEKPNTFILNWSYNSQIFDEITIKRMAEHLNKLALDVVNNANLPISHYNFISQEEEKKIIGEWSMSKSSYASDKSIHQLFEAQLLENPHKVAVKFDNGSTVRELTYLELNEKANQVAHYLIEKGIKSEDFVALYMDRSLEIIVAILGILKSGTAYVPIDNHLPLERQKQILVDAQISAIITQKSLANVFELPTVCVLEEEWEECKGYSKENPGIKSSPTHLAYLMYTSGSTGTPKGVKITHRNVIRLVKNTNYIDYDAERVWLQHSPLAFDASTLEIWGPLLNNSQLIIAKPGMLTPKQLGEIIKKHKVTTAWFTAALFHKIVGDCIDTLYPLQEVIAGGDTLSANAIKKIFELKNDIIVINGYGPTENTTFTSCYRMKSQEDAGSNVPIGYPINNSSVYILDDQLKPVAIGIPGMLYTGGDGVSPGYLNNPDLTAEKFIQNPFSNIANDYVYKTGDLARWRPDGAIEFLGRYDSQIKIRGFRIELSAIESCIKEYPLIKEVAVIVKELKDTKQVVAYFTRQSKEQIVINELKLHLQKILPTYMIPAFFIELTEIPLTSTGKVDKRNLSNREINLRSAQNKNNSSSYLLESNVHIEVLRIWKEIIAIDDISIDEGFFEVGGNSLLAMQLADRISKQFNIQFATQDLFKYTTVCQISEYINNYFSYSTNNDNAQNDTVKNDNYKTDPSKHTYKGTQISSYPDYYQDSLAIIGISCNFPGASNYREFWQNIKAGKESSKYFTKQELMQANVSEELIHNPHYIPVKFAIQGKDNFDPEFFNLSPKKAMLMDPQFRLLLLHSWLAIEDAGYVPSTIPETSVCISVTNSYYQYLLKNLDMIGASDEYVSWVLAQGGTIPTMISYELGLKGPSIFVHSNCSSSLVSLSLASQYIKNKEAKYALVGASALFPASQIGYIYEPGLNFSSDGHCRAFDALADGMVGGEGVGVIVLKNALEAIQDGDHIYALVRGVAVNNDGMDKAGFYAPSVNGQAQVIQKALSLTKVDPSTINYIETHGTGTKLGDTIEIMALSEAYQKYTSKKQFCGIGSVKPNIGHLDTAAGLAGCIKVALSLKNKEMPPSINFSKPNPKIDFANSPFYVVEKLQKWEKTDSPRRAGLSSFGIGGTNTHAILEEYDPTYGIQPRSSQISQGSQDPSSNTLQNRFIYPLSAKNNRQLIIYAENLLTFLQNIGDEINLFDLSFTLQTGRKAMQSRLAFIAQSVDELIEQLHLWLNNHATSTANHSLLGEVNAAKKTTELFRDNEDTNLLIEQWVNKGKLEKLTEFWVLGGNVDWNILYQSTKPQRLSLPTYPFEQENFAIDESLIYSMQTNIKQISTAAKLHPLLHQNTACFSDLMFTSIYTGKEFFLKDHQIHGKKILPAVAYLEIAQAAIKQSLATSDHNEALPANYSIELRNVSWVRPCYVDEQPQKINIKLSKDAAGIVSYEIYSTDLQHITYSQGAAVIKSLNSHLSNQYQQLDITDLLQQLKKITIEPKAYYEFFKNLGVSYGPAFEGIKNVYINQDLQEPLQILVQLQLPKCISESSKEFTLHPSLLDAALQPSVLWRFKEQLSHEQLPNLTANNSETQLLLPFALDSVDILAPCKESMWAWIRTTKSLNTEANQQNIQKLDIDLYDAEGKPCVIFKGFSYRKFDSKDNEYRANTNTVIMQSTWIEQTLPEKPVNETEYHEHLVFLCGIGNKNNNISCQQLQKKTSNNTTNITFTDFDSDAEITEQQDLAQRFALYLELLLKQIQDIIKRKLKNNILIQLLVPANGEEQIYAGLIGLLKTAQLENPKILPQVIAIQADETTDGLIEKIYRNSQLLQDQHIKYQDGIRLVNIFQDLPIENSLEQVPIKNNGIYLITGGAGGVGFILAKEIALKVQNASLILVGRSKLNTKKLQELQSLTANVEYKSLDIADKTSVEILINEIHKKYGALNGIIHSAGVVHDNFILKKTKQDVSQVLAPKVNGLINLDQTTITEKNLDFLALCSSGAAVLGNVGQADYAAANAFMDIFASYRNSLKNLHKRYGKTISINWPHWRNGGMQIDEITERTLHQRIGMVAMEDAAGIEAFYRAITSNASQVMVVYGNNNKIKESCGNLYLGNRENNLLYDSASPLQQTNIINDNSIDDEITEKTIEFLKSKLSKVLGLPLAKIDADESLDKYGIDSIVIMQLTNDLEKTFGSLSKTLFFEYQNIKDLSGYFLESYKKQLLKIFNIEQNSFEIHTNNKTLHNESNNIELNTVPYQPSKSSTTINFPTPKSNNKDNSQATDLTTDIAIIGLSGRYPQANNLLEYWQNLRNGKNCITEIPKDRWNWKKLYTEDRRQRGGHYSKFGGFINDVDKFDALFFNINPRDAELIDPQERLFLESVWTAIEDAGYTRNDLPRETGVYAGVMYRDYQLFGLEQSLLGNPISTGGSFSSVANRVSYFLDLHGPSMVVDTMCSASLTAIHIACQDLKSRQIQMAIAGGVNISIHPDKYLLLSQGQFISSLGQCQSFGVGGDGYIPSEGVGVVLLKRLQDAIIDSDHIYGIIKGSAINHGGKTNGYTVPNPNAQRTVITKVLEQSKIEPHHITYIEAHGTGTKLGDPIEITALRDALNTEYKTKHCLIGSVKSNIGHCESAAGIAGITKVLLQMKHAEIVPSLHSQILNPNIDFDNTPFSVNQELREWVTPIVNGKKLSKIAGVSSFGAGGSNAHIIIEEYIADEGARLNRDLNNKQILEHSANAIMVVLSAKTKDSLKQYAKNLLAFLESTDSQKITLQDLAYTFQVGREAMDERLGIIVYSLTELKEKLGEFMEEKEGIINLYRGNIKHNQEILADLKTDDEMQKTILAWVQKRKYSKLMNVWVKGMGIDWYTLYGDNRPNKISLPTYPFARERYWIGSAIDSSQQSTENKEADNNRTTVYLQKQWQESRAILAADIKDPCIIISTHETLPLAEQIKDLLPGSIIINLTDATDLLQSISQMDMRQFGGCLDIIGCGHEKNHSLEWVKVVQLFIEKRTKENVKILGITKGLESFQNNEINLSGALHAALYRMLQSEYAHISSMHLDLDNRSDDQTIIKEIIDEYRVTSNNPEICYRQGKRYSSVLAEVKVEDILQQNSHIKFKENQVLLITGGTGGLGFLCAEHFVKKYGVKRLVLIGRKPLPPREEWENYLKNSTGSTHADHLASKIQNLLQLEAQGITVKVLSTSLIDELALKQDLQQITTEFGEIAGVIHCAGEGDFNTPAFIKKSLQGIQKILNPKVKGLDNLLSVIPHQNLQFAILFSSVSSIIPTLATGYSDYAMANAYMDYIAEAMRDNLPLISIRWPSWREAGMGGITSKAYFKTGMLSHTNSEGLSILDQLLSIKNIPVILPAVVNPENWQPDKLMDRYISSESTNVAESVYQMQMKDWDRHVEQGEASVTSKRSLTPFRMTADNSSSERSIHTNQKYNRPLSKLAYAERFVEDSERKTASYLDVCEDLSTESTHKSLTEVEFGKRSNDNLLSVVPSKSLPQAIESWLVNIFAEELKLPGTKIELDRPFSDYGIESVLLSQISQTISTKLHERLDPSVLFEYTTIKALASWLNKTYTTDLSQLLHSESQTNDSKIIHINGLPGTTEQIFNFTAKPVQNQSLSNLQPTITSDTDIAVVAMSCRFPSANNIEEFWKLLAGGGSAIRAVPKERFGYENSYYAGLIDNITDFDHEFFLISPEDARAMDPQALLVLEESFNLFCHAGCVMEELKGSAVGVYLGARSHAPINYTLLQQTRNPIMTIGQNYLAANISHFFDLRGPSLVVDTACSSALVAMNLAIKDLQNGEVSSAVVGGVSLLLNDLGHKLFKQRKILAQGSEFHIFDQRASGVILGEGAGLVLLKTLKQAKEDGDHIYAVIKGLAVNNDGRTAGPATPNIEAQRSVMKVALRKSGMQAEDINYIEVNGSGSEVTDLLELKAIEAVYRSNNITPCGLGSIKPNIGHPLCAEGIASFIKLVLMFHNKQWVPFLSGTQALTHYNIDASPFYFNRTQNSWGNNNYSAALNCFADGGTNAHLILQGWQSDGENHIRRNPIKPHKFNRTNVHRGHVFEENLQQVNWWG